MAVGVGSQSDAAIIAQFRLVTPGGCRGASAALESGGCRQRPSAREGCVKVLNFDRQTFAGGRKREGAKEERGLEMSSSS